MLLAIAVLLCLALSGMVMGGSHGPAHVALVCCFVLAVLLVGLRLVWPPVAQYSSGAPVPGIDRRLPQALAPLARAPDPIELGVLLI